MGRRARERHAAPEPSRPGRSWLASESYGGDDKKLNFFNGEGVVVHPSRAAHTDGDSIVYFRGSDVLAAGDVINMTNYPVIDIARGGTIKGSSTRSTGCSTSASSST